MAGSMDIHVTNEMNPRNTGRVMDILRNERLFDAHQDYDPDTYRQWLGKVEAELPTGNRYALLAQLNNRAVGAIIWRQGSLPGITDIRNISIHPGVKGRYFGAFLLRQVEYCIGEQASGENTICVDTKATNRDMIGFLTSQGYRITGTRELYDDGRPDVLLQKQPNYRD